jgi:hypothetical protein
VDPNTGVAMYESDDIIQYLADTYGVYSTYFCLPLPCRVLSLAPSLLLIFSGDGTVPIMLKLGLLTVSNYVTYNPKAYDVLVLFFFVKRHATTVMVSFIGRHLSVLNVGRWL